MMYLRRDITPREKTIRTFGWVWVHRPFQFKYTMYLFFFSLGIMILVGTPVYWIYFQNYELFTKLSYETAPNLIVHLRREFSSLNIYIVGALGAILLAAMMMGFKFTAKIIAPLLLLQKHIYQFSKGNLSQPPLKTRSTDEHHELIWNYNYLYRSFQTNTELEIKQLQKLAVDPYNREAFLIWQNLIKTKLHQLGRDPNAELIVESHQPQAYQNTKAS